MSAPSGRVVGTMIAAVEAHRPTGPCIVYWTGRVGLSVKATTYCGNTVSAADGVLQLPDIARVCIDCSAAVQRGEPVNART